jgi:hypothetical protein
LKENSYLCASLEAGLGEKGSTGFGMVEAVQHVDKIPLKLILKKVNNK